MAKLTLARSERMALADELAVVGPDAPTLCAGWQAVDLAAHLVIRERRLDAAPGIMLKPLSGWTRRVQQGVAAQPYEDLVALVRSGPPRWSPLGWPGVDEAANALEMFLHHEDVRRAQRAWAPRSLTPAHEQELWRRLGGIARLATRRAPGGIVLRQPNGEALTVRRGEPIVTVTGPPAELLLFASGRQRHARVELAGDPSAVARLWEAPFGL